jgi:hypothetical protein
MSENVYAAEVSSLDEAEGLLTDGEFSEVLVLEVSVDLGFLSEGGVLELKLLLVDVEVLLALVGEAGELLDLV